MGSYYIPDSMGLDDIPAEPCQAAPQGCHISDLFSVLSKAHMLDILYIFEHAGEPVRFKDLEARLAISPNTLSSRLKQLVESGFITRKSFAEIPPRVEYEPTEKAIGLNQVFRALNDWAQAHTLQPVLV